MAATLSSRRLMHEIFQESFNMLYALSTKIKIKEFEKETKRNKTTTIIIFQTIDMSQGWTGRDYRPTNLCHEFHLRHYNKKLRKGQ